MTYVSSDPSVVVATNQAGNKSRIEAVAPGVATVTAVRAEHLSPGDGQQRDHRDGHGRVRARSHARIRPPVRASPRRERGAVEARRPGRG